MSNTLECPIVVLLGGGVESTSLVSRFLSQQRRVVPVHVHCGLIWDDVETLFVQQFCQARASDNLDPLIQFQIPLAGWLDDHWAVTGNNIPRAGARSHDLEIPLRNLMLLSFALPKVAHLSDFQCALGTTADNSFRDGSRAYFDSAQELLSLEAGRPIEILTPYIQMTKTDVIRETDRDTLAHSFSCVDPRDNQHCGCCIKCGSRQQAFMAAGIDDPTVYADA
ncbi:7-cyano-7-deazaguanine synthase [Symmachiella dynata]|uniref:7-cyano-7-deazaguanine synthase n=1 Tax=Symmachiella dynata TaxID=2527995 RepID=UPI00118A5C65|nr:7-cyano-7-deazaguanine synthase [Symmachiella dynata]QDT51514.1 7-cyano-7-deazaguanine synthase [Symmachiella dynata]